MEGRQVAEALKYVLKSCGKAKPDDSAEKAKFARVFFSGERLWATDGARTHVAYVQHKTGERFLPAMYTRSSVQAALETIGGVVKAAGRDAFVGVTTAGKEWTIDGGKQQAAVTLERWGDGRIPADAEPEVPSELPDVLDTSDFIPKHLAEAYGWKGKTAEASAKGGAGHPMYVRIHAGKTPVALAIVLPRGQHVTVEKDPKQTRMFKNTKSAKKGERDLEREIVNKVKGKLVEKYGADATKAADTGAMPVPDRERDVADDARVLLSIEIAHWDAATDADRERLDAELTHVCVEARVTPLQEWVRDDARGVLRAGPFAKRQVLPDLLDIATQAGTPITMLVDAVLTETAVPPAPPALTHVVAKVLRAHWTHRLAVQQCVAIESACNAAYAAAGLAYANEDETTLVEDGDWVRTRFAIPAELAQPLVTLLEGLDGVDTWVEQVAPPVAAPTAPATDDMIDEDDDGLPPPFPVEPNVAPSPDAPITTSLDPAEILRSVQRDYADTFAVRANATVDVFLERAGGEHAPWTLLSCTSTQGTGTEFAALESRYSSMRRDAAAGTTITWWSVRADGFDSIDRPVSPDASPAPATPSLAVPMGKRFDSPELVLAARPEMKHVLVARGHDDRWRQVHAGITKGDAKSAWNRAVKGMTGAHDRELRWYEAGAVIASHGSPSIEQLAGNATPAPKPAKAPAAKRTTKREVTRG